MKKLAIYFFLIFGGVGFAVAPCYAEYEEPMERNTVLTLKYDRMAVPSSVTIWNALSGGQGGTQGRISPFLLNTLVCKSTSDSTNGACARTSPVYSGSNSDGNIRLKFTLDGTSTSVDLTVVGRRQASLCTAIPPSSFFTCTGGYIAGGFASFTYTIARSELAKLASPGVWKATLKQDLWQWAPPKYLHTWTASIALTVTDQDHAQIYFPAFPYSAPKVDLKLHNRPGARTASGSASLDMCLYDGNNSHSSRADILFVDESPHTTPGRAAGSFSVYLNGADGSQAANRIDYQVSVINPTTGATQAIKNGARISWTDTDRRNIQRLVVLPGVPGWSYCLPAPIQLTTPAFNLADKAAGDYTGKLTIIYSPSP